MPAKVKGGSTKMAAPSSLLVCKWRKKWAAAGKLVNLCEKLWIPRSRDFARARACVCVCVCVCVISFRAKFINVEVSTRRIGRKNIYIDFGQRGTFLWIMKNINSLSLF